MSIFLFRLQWATGQVGIRFCHSHRIAFMYACKIAPSGLKAYVYSTVFTKLPFPCRQFEFQIVTASVNTGVVGHAVAQIDNPVKMSSS